MKTSDKAQDRDEAETDHYVTRSNWLRAAVLGAHDGIISISGLAVGIAAASATREPVMLGTVAGLAAGALSMAAGEYVSVGLQADSEAADIAREAQALAEHPEEKLAQLTKIYRGLGVSDATARQAAIEATESDALAAHVRAELGINDIHQPKPLQAALASLLAFTCGGMLPLSVVLLAPDTKMAFSLYGFSLVFLIVLGVLSAKTGGSSVAKAVLRTSIWGTLAMGVSAAVGALFGVVV